MKLIADPFNGYRWQWKYFDTTIGRWFDYGRSYTTRKEAEHGMGHVDKRTD